MEIFLYIYLVIVFYQIYETFKFLLSELVKAQNGAQNIYIWVMLKRWYLYPILLVTVLFIIIMIIKKTTQELYKDRKQDKQL
tara:strand:+ start:243 stop:488 length:246 start_codon:yes stop_codon:yes gene_type:complete